MKPLSVSAVVHISLACAETKSLSSFDPPSSFFYTTLCLFPTLSSSTSSSIFGWVSGSAFITVSVGGSR